MTTPVQTERKVTIGSYIALAFAVVFFSGLLQSNQWYGVFDFTTLNGAFGKVAYGVNETADGVQARPPLSVVRAVAVRVMASSSH